MSTEVLNEVYTELKQISDAVKRRDADLGRLRDEVATLAQKLAETVDWQKKVEERLANIEEALHTKPEPILSKLSLDGATPKEKFENFLALKADRDEIAKWQDLCDAYAVYALIRKHRNLPYEDSRLAQKFQEVAKQVTGTHLPGYIPVQFSARVTELVRLQPGLANLFERISMDSDTLRVPVQFSGVRVYKVSAGGQITLSTPTAPSPVEFVTVKLGAGISIVDEVTEDSIVPIIPAMQREIAFAFALAIDDAISNGDTSTTHMDSDVTQPSDVRKSWQGLRKRALSGTAKVDLATFNVTNLRAIRAAMGVYGLNPQRLVWVVSPSAYVKMLSLSEVLTVDKYGPQATILSGELGKLDGIPILLSPVVREDLNASGVYDGTTTTKTCIYLVNRDAWALAERRNMRLEADRDITSQIDILVATWRGDFKAWYASGNIVGIGYNLAKS